MSKRAGKTGNRKHYNGHTQGPGGLKCECCGAVHNAGKVIRRKNKQELKKKFNCETCGDTGWMPFNDPCPDCGEKES